MIGLSNPLQSIRALLPKEHIFLLSHMRANTSLFGHIAGSNPSICGYYEMHIGYHSWKSLTRQKLLFFREEDIKPDFSCMFDKVLHDDHEIAPEILNNSRSRIIFSLRRPQETIPSIMKLYGEIDPSHDFNRESFATDYYIGRLTSLSRLADSLNREFFYFDAECLKQDTERCLASLSQWLQLDTPLSPNYTLQRNTSRQRYGDTSGMLDKGQVVTRPSAYKDFHGNPDSMNRAIQSYREVRQSLLKKSASCSTIREEFT